MPELGLFVKQQAKVGMNLLVVGSFERCVGGELVDDHFVAKNTSNDRVNLVVVEKTGL